MNDSYYTPPDEPEFECVSCDGTGEGCSHCDETGRVGSEAICSLCGCYPCRCDDDYDSWRDAQEDMWGQ
jgi:hypothetical protein